MSSAIRWTPYDRPAQFGVIVDKAVPVRMPDGAVLRANVYRPDAPGRFPVLLYQNPYGSNGLAGNAGGGNDPYLTARGYVQLVVDVRGTGQSDGSWDPFGPLEQRDGYDLVEWAARQSWSNGKVGTAGGSYLAIAQLFTAALRPPHLKAAFPIVPMGDIYRDMVMTGGSVNTAFIPAWTGVVASGMVQPPAGGSVAGSPSQIANHVTGVTTTQSRFIAEPLSGGEMAYDNAYYASRSPLEVVDRIQVPTFVVGKLHDIFQRGEPLLYERLKRRVPTRLLTLPGYHTTAERLPADGVPDLKRLQLRWFDHYLKGLDSRLDEVPQVTQYRLGDGHYRTQPDWPHPKMQTQRLYLRGGGALAPAAPKAAEPTQTFLQQPVSGACTLSTEQWTAGTADALPCETASKQHRDELLGAASYSTPPLTSDLVLDGPLLADLWVTTTARDLPLTVRVSDVAPDGSITELTDGWLSASFRAVDRERSRYVGGRLQQPWHPFTRGSVLPVEPGEPMRLAVEVFPTSALLRKGHSLRLTVAASDVPHQLPPATQLAGSAVGIATILTDPAHPSYLQLPSIGTTCAAGAVGGRCASLPGPRLVRR